MILNRRVSCLLLAAGAALQALFMIGCVSDERHRGGASETGTPIDSVIASAPTVGQVMEYRRGRVAEMMQSAPRGLDPCRIAQDVTRAIDTILRWPVALYRNQDDSCVHELLLALERVFMTTGDGRILEAFDSLSAYSDGYVGEALSQHAHSMATRRSDRFFAYVLDEKRSVPPVGWNFVSWNQVEFEDRPTSAKRAQLTSAINDSLADLPLTGAQRARLDSMLREAKLID